MTVQTCKIDGRDDKAAELRRRLVIDVFKAIGDPSRAAILASLAEAEGPLRVGEIGTCCPQDLSVVSRHLRILRDAGVVEAERQGREVRYWIRTGELVKLLRDLADALEACCSEDAGSSLSREVQ